MINNSGGGAWYGIFCYKFLVNFNIYKPPFTLHEKIVVVFVKSLENIFIWSREIDLI